MINVIASIRIKEGQVEEFLEIFKANVPHVLAEKGCVEYMPTMDVPTGLPPQELDDRVVTIIEKWDSLEDLKTHLTAPHMRTYQERVRDMVENVSIKILAEA